MSSAQAVYILIFKILLSEIGISQWSLKYTFSLN